MGGSEIPSLLESTNCDEWMADVIVGEVCDELDEVAALSICADG